MNKSFSIIIPFYKGDSFYPILIESIKKAILNCDKTILFEIITVIDSIESNYEELSNLVEGYFHNIHNVTIITLKNSQNIGVAGSRNKAIRLSKGNFLHVIDQDDVILESFYSEIIPLLNIHNFILSNGLVSYINSNYNTHKLYYFKPNLTLHGLLKSDYIRSPGQVVFSKVLLKNNLFPEPITYKGSDDHFFWLILFNNNQENISPYYINNTNYIAYIHSDNYSNDKINLKKSNLENWDLILSKTNTFQFQRLIQNDIIRIKFILGEKLSLLNTLKGWFLNIHYFLEFNKLIRFIIKRNFFKK